jgi:hypothetical protein
MAIFAWLGFIFGLIGFTTAHRALTKVAKLEAELKRRRLIDESLGK